MIPKRKSISIIRMIYVSRTSLSVRNSRYARATATQKAGSIPIWRSNPLLISRRPVVSTENVGVRSVNVNNGMTISPARDEVGARVNDAVGRIGRVGVI